MAKVLFLFMDGVGLGKEDSRQNPLVAARMPILRSLLNGQHLIQSSIPYEGEFASILSIDARLGVEGRPQSATGQATLLTGRNVPALLGMHYGPKPNPTIRKILETDNLFQEVRRRGGTAALLNAYPPSYFEAVSTRRRLHGAIPLAVTQAGWPLMTAEDLIAGRALAPDFTGEGWRAQPNFPPIATLDPAQAGRALARLSMSYDLTWFDYWPTDIAGHRWTMDQAIQLLEVFDAVLAGLIDAWQTRKDFVILSSDHGNLEEMNHRRHTTNPVPALLIGPKELRTKVARDLSDLTHIKPAILRILFEGDHTA